jgi:hypothetical protein
LKYRIVPSLRFVRRRGLASGFFCGCLGTQGFPEWLHCNVLVGDFLNGEVGSAGGCIENDEVAFFGLDQGAAERGDPTDVIAVEIDFVGADDAYDSLVSFGIGIAHGGSKEDTGCGLARSGSFGVYDDGGFNSLHKEAQAGIDLTEAALAVLVVCVFAAIAVAGSPGDYGLNGRTFSGQEKVVFVFEAREATRCYVVLDRGAGGVGLRYSGEAFSHGGAVNEGASELGWIVRVKGRFA